MKQRTKQKKYARWKFDLKECEVHINLIERSNDKGYATAYMNIHLPDGRWAVFTMDKDCRIPLFEEEASS